MKDGIPNLSTPADLFDRLIIERLKVEQVRLTKDPNETKIKQALTCVDALKEEISRLLVSTHGNMTDLVHSFDDLVVAVSTVSYCENEKARLQNKKDPPSKKIADLDKISRKANEDRAAHKRAINLLFEKLTGNKNLQEARTF